MQNRRFDAIDILRGLVMVLMAIDHTRDYFHADAFYYSPTDLESTSVPVFLTRWITHFCAPVFVFLAGTSAFIIQKKKGKEDACRFLLKRGMWLIFLEMTFVSFGWSFAIVPGGFMQVIWAIGCSMVVLSFISRWPLVLIFSIGLLIVFGHNLLDSVEIQTGNPGYILWAILHEGGAVSFGSFSYYFAYPVLPWIGVILLGFVFGKFYTEESWAVHRRMWLTGLGLASVLLFLVLRIPNWYGNPVDWQFQESISYNVLAVLNVNKYPPSLHYILMTLGPAFLFLAFVEQWRGKVADFLLVFGRVPLFFYMLHLYLIHSLAIINVLLFFPDHHWSMLLIKDWAVFYEQAQGYGFSLPGVYMVTALVVVISYPLCKWYGVYKRSHPEKWWLSYL